ncbi:class I SAM-dependent methyltransferase [Nocardiopsis alba]|uniref:class I SAM-dependent methyltransferase n=1 Tax=Nocardiopsis alba TaxID=53437 RepID=UPI003F4CF255
MHDSVNEEPEYPTPGGVERRSMTIEESARAGRRWWDGAADAYQFEHGDFLRDVGFVWSPEGVDEARARLLGDVAGARILEIGCGAGQCSRWLRDQGVGEVVAFDVSLRQLQHSRRIDEQTGLRVPTVQADVQRLPFADASFDVAFSAFGAFPFVPAAEAALAETARVLKPGGRFVFSVTHPIRWCFPDDPTEHGMTLRQSYFDRRAYVEEDEHGRALYAEHHHTVGDWIRGLVAAGLVVRDMVEPEWPEDNDQVWGGWGPVRGRVLPGTAIFVTTRP